MQSVVKCVTIIQITSIIVSSEGLDPNTSFLGPSALAVRAFVHSHNMLGLGSRVPLLVN